jgi:hypothetical protein
MPQNNMNTDTEDAALRKRVAGAVNVLYHTYNSLLLRRVIKAKRECLDKKIRRNMKHDRLYAGNVNYITPRIIFLRSLLFLSTFFFRVATKLKSVGRA